MYTQRSRFDFYVAIAYWIIRMGGLWIMGLMFKHQIKGNNLILIGIALIGVIFVLIKDRNPAAIGFTGDNLKSNLIISLSLVAVSFNIYFPLYSEEKVATPLSLVVVLATIVPSSFNN